MSYILKYETDQELLDCIRLNENSDHIYFYSFRDGCCGFEIKYSTGECYRCVNEFLYDRYGHCLDVGEVKKTNETLIRKVKVNRLLINL